MSKKIPTEIKKAIERIALKLPPIQQLRIVKYDEEGEPVLAPVAQLQFISGDTAMKKGFEKDSNRAEKIETQSNYLHQSEVKINHEKKLRKAYQQGGLDEMKKYVESIVDLKDSSNLNFMEVVKILNQIIFYANTNKTLH